jgi:hypothetical protein
MCVFTISIAVTLPSILLTEHYENDTRQPCTLIQYTNCLSSIPFNHTKQYKSCTDACVPACDHWDYELRILDERSSDNGTGIFVPYAQHVEIVQRSAYSWDVIIANFGGLMEFWIGAGFVTFFHMFLFGTEKVDELFFNLLFLLQTFIDFGSTCA